MLAQRLAREKARTWPQAGLSIVRTLVQNNLRNKECWLASASLCVCPLGEIPSNKNFQCVSVWGLWGLRILGLLFLDWEWWNPPLYVSRSLLMKKQQKTQDGHGYGTGVLLHRRLGIQWVNSTLPWPPILKVLLIINLKSLIGQKSSLLPYPKGSQNLIAGALFVQAIFV